ILQPLLEQDPARVVIANRTVSKAEQLARGFHDAGDIQAVTYEDLAGKKFDVVINGTSASLNDELPPLPDDLLAEGAYCYDMMYGADPTIFLQWAHTHGAAQTADGLGMLVGQAAEAFYVWRQIRPEVVPVINAMRRQLNERK